MCGLGKRTIIYWEMGDGEIKCSKLVPLVREYDLDFNWLILGSGSMFNEANFADAAGPEMLETELHEPEAPESSQQWTEKPPSFKKEEEDVLPLIQRLRRK
jgi:hypothetical protein